MHRAKHSTYDIRVQAVRTFHNGMPVASIAKAYQTHRSTVYRWVALFENEGGVKGLVRKPASGRPQKLASLDEVGLSSIILKPACDFGYQTDFWTCSRLLQVIRKEFGIEISKWTIWRRLHIYYLPSYSPDWNPDEKVWNHSKHEELNGHMQRQKRK